MPLLYKVMTLPGQNLLALKLRDRNSLRVSLTDVFLDSLDMVTEYSKNVTDTLQISEGTKSAGNENRNDRLT